MIYIVKSQQNIVALTLDEKATVSVHDWLFEFTNQLSGEVVTFTAQDLSTTTARYNKFIITESLTPNLYNGIISLDNSGSWSYNVYEMPVTSPVSLNKANALACVESGKVFVFDSTQNNKVPFIGDGDSKNAKTFDV